MLFRGEGGGVLKWKGQMPQTGNRKWPLSDVAVSLPGEVTAEDFDIGKTGSVLITLV